MFKLSRTYDLADGTVDLNAVITCLMDEMDRVRKQRDEHIRNIKNRLRMIRENTYPEDFFRFVQGLALDIDKRAALDAYLDQLCDINAAFFTVVRPDD